MMLRKMRLFHKTETGFTLIEIMVSLVITGFIGLGAAMSSAQVLTQTSRNSDYTTASRNAMNAVYWIGRDAQMAQVISGSAGFPGTSDLILSWDDWENVSYNATYSLDDGKLTRTYTVGGLSKDIVVAEYINSTENMTYCTSDNGTLILKITSSVGEGSKVVDVTRIREVTARPQL